MPPGTVAAMGASQRRDRGVLYREAALLREAPAAPAAESSPAEAESESRVRRFIASDETVDAYNTRIKLDAWDLTQYEKNPLVLFGHGGGYGSDLEQKLPIGTGRAFVDGQQLVGEVTFLDETTSPLAERILRILDAGLLAMSVGFDPLESEYSEERETGDPWEDLWYPPLDYTKVRLLELSVVTLPANPNALPMRGMSAEVRSRLARRLSPPSPPPPPPSRQAPPPAPAPSPKLSITREEIAALTRAELTAALRRRTGNTRGT